MLSPVTIAGASSAASFCRTAPFWDQLWHNMAGAPAIWMEASVISRGLFGSPIEHTSRPFRLDVGFILLPIPLSSAFDDRVASTNSSQNKKLGEIWLRRVALGPEKSRGDLQRRQLRLKRFVHASGRPRMPVRGVSQDYTRRKLTPSSIIARYRRRARGGNIRFHTRAPLQLLLSSIAFYGGQRREQLRTQNSRRADARRFGKRVGVAELSVLLSRGGSGYMFDLERLARRSDRIIAARARRDAEAGSRAPARTTFSIQGYLASLARDRAAYRAWRQRLLRPEVWSNF